MRLVKELYLEERQQKILKWTNEQGRVSVAELSQKLGVSGVTIRTDLHVMAERKLIIRTHGGAIPAGDGRYEIALALRRQKQIQEKNRIGRVAADLVSDGDAIFIDSSSTTLTIVKHLKIRRQLTIITNSLAVTQELQNTPGIKVVMPGGILQNDTASLIGVDQLVWLQKFNIQKGFFGAHGITLAEGLTDVNSEEAEVKKELVSMCHQTIVLIDATKWGQVGLASFAKIQDINIIITDTLAPETMVERIQASGIKIILT